MIYQKELAAAGYEGDPHGFRVLLADVLKAEFPDRSPDDVLDHPGDSDRFCDVIQHRARNWRLDDYLILSMLIDTRKNHEDLIPKIRRRPRPLLAKQLQACGCGMHTEEFLDVLSTVFDDGYSDAFTDESIRYRPRVARGYCRRVRELVMCSEVTDDLIIRSLNNARKAGRQLVS